MATLSAATAASLLVGLMAIAPKPRGNGPAAPDRAVRAADHGRSDSLRRVTAAAPTPRTNHP